MVLSSSQPPAAEGIHFNKQEKNFHFKKIYEKKLKNFKIKFHIKKSYNVNKSININLNNNKMNINQMILN